MRSLQLQEFLITEINTHICDEVLLTTLDRADVLRVPNTH
jgi:hypothetical protein